MHERPWLVRTIGGRFTYLFCALIALMLSVPLLELGPLWNILIVVCTSGVLVACLHAAEPGRAAVRFGMGLAVVDIVLGRLVAIDARPWLIIVQSLLWVITLVYVIAKLLRAVFERDRVDAQTLQAALCIYLLIGFIWIYLYALIDLSNPASFRYEGKPNPRWTDHESRFVIFARLFLYSFSKLTSSGYDALTASSTLSNICASLEALSGQVFLAVVIARLVGLQIVQANTQAEASVDRRLDALKANEIKQA
jgi:hypothetical protein